MNRAVRRTAAAGAMLLLVLLGAEAAGWVAYRAITGKAFSYLGSTQEESGVVDGPVSTTGPGAPRDDAWTLDREMIHPFLGFTQNPGITVVPDGDGVRVRSPITEHGFFDFDAMAEPPDARGRPVVVALVGGSVMVHLAKDAAPLLARRLMRGGRWPGRRVLVVNWANPGYKQPQQALTVAYMASLGAVPDVVVNLDGYNDLVLGYTENLRSGVFPFFPRRWDWRVRGLPDLATQRLAGEVVAWRRLRQEWRHLVRESPWSRSAVVSTGALHVERWLGSHEAAAHRRLLEEVAAPPSHDYLRQGPPVESWSEDEYLEAAVAVWQRSSRTLAALTRDLGVDYLHALQPNQYDAGSKPMARAERVVALADNRTAGRLVAAGYPRLSRAGAELAAGGVNFLDLRLVFQGVEEPLYVDACCHVDRRGSEILARALADELLALPRREERP